MIDFTKFKNLPSIVWVFIFVFGIIALIGGIIGTFILLGTVPGVASAIFLIIGFFYVTGPGMGTQSSPVDNVVRAIGVGFFALMGVAVDQTGNFIYNYPLRYFCPEGTQLNRTTDVSHPLPGRTDLTQVFECFDANDKKVSQISLGYVIGLRFVEYIVLAYALIGLRHLRLSSLKSSKAEVMK